MADKLSRNPCDSVMRMIIKVDSLTRVENGNIEHC